MQRLDDNFLCVWLSAVRAEPKTIVAFGDSLTQGYGLPADAGFVPQMGALVGARRACLCAWSMLGFRVTQPQVGWHVWIGHWLRPADLVIVNLGSNDMLRGLDPNLVYTNLKQIMDKLETKNMATLLIGHLGPLNYGAGYKSDYDGAFEKLAASYDTVFYPFFFKTLMAADGVTPNLQLYFQADGMHPNAAGVQAVVADMGPYVLRALQQ